MILLFDEFQAYGLVKSIGLWLCALAAIIAGYRIYQQWNRGEDVEGPLVLWLTSIAFCGGVVFLVDRFILSGAFSSSFGGSDYMAQVYTQSMVVESSRAALLLGIVVAIIGLIRVFQKFRRGDDDLYDFMFKWFGSLAFLFLMSSIISTML
ncbi:DUF4134 family protein [Fibrella aquatilis]|uniref:DUF4134 family protein n=1 Tax=Fibrella aquatilis TaxID=2817059 RepID=A0A939G8Q5_9BACT|nr:DUF4134 family protein [Fibrella aquatilis]MBO0931863.1 DUF4134 family protein [Fibrella aquatilis]